MAEKDTQLADHPRGLRSRCELLAMSGQVARNAPAPVRVLVFAMCVHVACTVRMRYSIAPFPSCGRHGARPSQPLTKMLAASDTFFASCA